MTAAGRFPAAAGLAWAEVGGGFSGARVWRGVDPAGVPKWALKQLPAGFPADRLRQVHRWMRANRSSLVPTVAETASSETVVELAGHIWECVGWVLGTPLDPAGRPQVLAACVGLAELHRGWATSTRGPLPCVGRRRAVLAEPLPDHSHPLVRRAIEVVRRARPAAVAVLDTLPADGPVQPCLCDPRPEHFLFAGGRLFGVIDYSAMKSDHPAVDLARLLGDTGHLAEGVEAYRSAGGRPGVTPDLVRALADTGLIGAAANWALRLAGRDPTRTEADRLERLLGRLVHW